MDYRHYFLKSKYADRLYMNVLRPAGYLALIYPREKFYISKNREKYKYLAEYRNKYKGKRCFIIGTGPSLKKEDLLSIKDEIFIGVNSLCLWKDILSDINYFFISDIVAYRKLYEDLPQGCFVSSHCLKTCGDLSASQFRVIPVCRFNYFVPYTERFSLDITSCFYDFNSVVFIALQFAVYAGFKEIYLLGVDCNYSTEKIYAVDHGIRHRKEYMEDVGKNMIKGFAFVRQFLQENEISTKIYNASSGGMLEVFPRVNLQKIIKGE